MKNKNYVNVSVTLSLDDEDFDVLKDLWDQTEIGADPDAEIDLYDMLTDFCMLYAINAEVIGNLVSYKKV